MIILLYLFLILLLFNALIAGVIGLIIYFSRKPRLKRFTNAPQKLSYIKKLFYYNLNSTEYQTLCKIKFNYPTLRADDGDFLQLIKDVGFNLNLPMYKISLYRGDSLKGLSKQLDILRKLEEYGYPTNIAINYKQKDFNLNDIIYIVRQQSFIKSVIKIHNADDISLKLMCAINIFNINYHCDTKRVLFDAKNIGYSVDIDNNRYNFFDESYFDYTYTSKATTQDYTVISRRTFDYNNNFKLSRFNFINLSKHKSKVTFNLNIAFAPKDNDASYFTYTNTRNTLTVYDIKESRQVSYVSNLPIFAKVTLSKRGLTINYKVTKQTYLFVAECYNQQIQIQDFVQGEELFVKAKHSYRQLQPIKVFTPNPIFNKLINQTLPNRIITSVIYKPDKYYNDFVNFINKQSICPQNIAFLCQDYLNLQSLFITNKNAVVDYFSLLYIYLGVYFDRQGIRFNPNKSHILSNSNIAFVKDDVNYHLDINNSSQDTTTCRIGGVEYSNLKFVKYNQLNNKLVLQF